MKITTKTHNGEESVEDANVTITVTGSTIARRGCEIFVDGCGEEEPEEI